VNAIAIPGLLKYPGFVVEKKRASVCRK